MHAATRCLYWRSYFTATVTAGLRSCCAVAADYCALAQEYEELRLRIERPEGYKFESKSFLD